MFTGLVGDIGEILQLDRATGTTRLRIATRYPARELALGASIACGGPCLTVIAAGASNDGRNWFDTDATAETEARTTLGRWRVGTRLNLERSLKLGDEMGGHLVTGHIDGTAEILERTDRDGTAAFTLRAPAALAPLIAAKGSVALDGTSLTVNGVDGDRFSVLLIPHSLAVTTWGERRAGDRVNLEVDLMARYVARLAEAHQLR